MSARGALDVDGAVVGGGIFGCWLALYLARHCSPSVVVVEREAGLLRRASYVNQARVHSGYHYPRSILTGLRSRVNSERFVREYAECVDATFTSYYAVARVRSNVTAAQFERLCERIGTPLPPAEPAGRALFNQDLIERVWRAEEWAFDATTLERRMASDLAAARGRVLLGHEALRVARIEDGRRLEVSVRDTASNGARPVTCDYVFNATYSSLNGLLARSGVERIPLKQEITDCMRP